MGISGRLSRFFLTSQLTPLLALVALLLGVFALSVTPREEEPQIDVTMANVMIPFTGASAHDVERLVAAPAEQVLAQIQGIEHVYSVSRPNMAVLTVQFKVGVARNDALVRLHEALDNHKDWLAPELGVGEAQIKSRGIDDVPILALTLWSDNPQHGAADLGRIAHSAEAELKRVAGTREVYTLGARERIVSVALDSAQEAAGQLRFEIEAAFSQGLPNTPMANRTAATPVTAGQGSTDRSSTVAAHTAAVSANRTEILPTGSSRRTSSVLVSSSHRAGVAPGLPAPIWAMVSMRTGCRPALRHLMSMNFSAPRSAPKPASVTT